MNRAVGRLLENNEARLSTVVLGMLTIVFVFYLASAILVLATSSMSNGEYMQVDWINRIPVLGSPYTVSDEFVEGVTPAYPPLYYYVSASVSGLVGSEIFAGKLVSFLAFLVTCVFAYLISERLTSKKWVGFLAVTVLALHPVLSNLSTTVRPDCLAMMFTAVGIYLVIREKYYWAIPLFLLAVFTKQTYLAAPVAVGIYLFFSKSKLGSAKWLFLFCSTGAVTFLLVNFLTHGELYKHVILYPFSSGSVHYTLEFSIVALLFLIVPLLFSLAYLIVYRDFGFMSFYLLVSLVIMIALIGKEGAGINYSFELALASSILMGLFFNRLVISRLSGSLVNDGR